MTGRQYLMQFVMIFLGSMIFVALGLFATFMERRERRRNQLR
jgi:hypothetical protein